MQIRVKKITQLTGHNGAIYSLAEGEAKHLLLSAAGDGWIVQWDLVNSEVGRLVAKADKNLFAMQYALRPSQNLLLGDMDGGLHWINLKNAALQNNIAKHQKGIFDIKIINNHAITIGGDGFLHRWNLQNKTITDSLQLSYQSLRCMDFSAAKNEIAIGSSDRNIYLLDATSLSLKTVISQAHTNSVFAVQYSPDSQYLVSGGRDAMLNVWHLEKEIKNIATQAAHLYTINKILFHHEGKFFATASRDKTIKIWDSQTFQLLKVIDVIKFGGHVGSVNTLFWSAYNHWLISGSDDKTLIVWEIEEDV
jgi:WD40 repeat protein